MTRDEDIISSTRSPITEADRANQAALSADQRKKAFFTQPLYARAAVVLAGGLNGAFAAELVVR